MSLDDLVSAERTSQPNLCLPHQCEFLSDQWLDQARIFLTAATASRTLPPFSLVERFRNTPRHLGFENNLALWSATFDGQQLRVSRSQPNQPNVSVDGDYQAGLFVAQAVGASIPDAMGRTLAELYHLFGDDALHSTGTFNDPQVNRLFADFHDHMARITVENPDISHRAQAFALNNQIQHIKEQGYAVIKNAITEEFADEVRETSQRAVSAHGGNQLQWMLYQGLPLERLAQNAPLMTLIDATLGRGAVIASLSAIVRGPGPGQIPLHNDYSMIPEPYPDFAMTGVGVWALEDWTPASGPTWIVPGSHLTRRAPRPGEDVSQAVPIEMPKGSVVYFTHGVWHWQGDRSEAGERVTIHAHFNRGILRGLEPKKIDPQMLHRNAPRLGEMLGEDDWFDKLDAHGRDYARAAHMARLQKFTNDRLAALE